MNGVADGPHAPWREKIPDRWERIPGLAAVRENKRRNAGMVEETVLSLSYGRIVIKPPEKLTGLVPESFETYQVMEPGDLVIRTTDLQNDWTSLRVGLVKTPGIITSAYVGLKPTKRFSPEFLYYLLHSYDTKKVFYGMGSGLRQNICFDDFKWLPFICPPRPEQDAIVAYLDDKLEMIDRYLRVKEREIALLEERKRALIHRAVTRGLDPNAKLQPYGIPWLPEIPVGWKGIALRRLLNGIDQGVSPLTVEGEVEGDFWGVLKSGATNDGVFREEECKRLPPAFPIDPSIVVQEGDILVSRASGSTKHVGSVARVGPLTKRLILSDKNFRLDLKNPAFAGFLAIAMMSYYFRRQLELVISGAEGLANNLPSSALKALRIAVPPEAVAMEIESHLSAETSQIDTTITRARQQIERMQEYRTALIAEAMTGKIDITTAN